MYKLNYCLQLLNQRIPGDNKIHIFNFEYNRYKWAHYKLMIINSKIYLK